LPLFLAAALCAREVKLPLLTTPGLDRVLDGLELVNAAMELTQMKSETGLGYKDLVNDYKVKRNERDELCEQGCIPVPVKHLLEVSLPLQSLRVLISSTSAGIILNMSPIMP
jgi:hypothetical protein